MGAHDPGYGGEGLHDAATARLRSAQQRYTRGRRALVDVLAEVGHPLTIGEVLAALPVTAQSSVYRNLSVLEGAGVVRRVQAEDEYGRFELSEDLTGHHHHLLCAACGRVTDYTPPARLERAVQNIMEEVTTQTGFRPSAHRVDLVGLCAACA